MAGQLLQFLIIPRVIIIIITMTMTIILKIKMMRDDDRRWVIFLAGVRSCRRRQEELHHRGVVGVVSGGCPRRPRCPRRQPLLQPLGPPFVELNLVDGPNGPFDVLDPHETLVERQVVSDGILPSGRVPPEVTEGTREPIVDFVQGQLAFGRFTDCL